MKTEDYGWSARVGAGEAAGARGRRRRSTGGHSGRVREMGKIERTGDFSGGKG